MSIIRVERRSCFTTVPNDLINDESLRWQDLGVLVYLLSKPSDWSISVRQLSSVRSMGVDGIREVMRRLRSSGYVEYRKLSTGDVEYIVSDSPSSDEAKTGKSLTGKKPNRENPDVILKTDSDNQRLIEETNPPLTPPGGDSAKKPAKFSPEDVELPDWLPRNCWLEWCTHRKQIRKPMTSLATTKAIMFLQEQHASGTEPEAIIEQAIRSGWQGLYPLKRSQTNVNENNHARVIRAHIESHDFITDEELAAMRSDAERRKRGVWGSRC